MDFNWQLDINTIIGMIVFIGGGLYWLYDIKVTVNHLAASREQEHKDNLEKFNEIEAQLSKITDVVVELAQQKEQIKNLYSTIADLKDEVRSARKQRAVKPYTPGPSTIKRKRSS